jgi:hypothetical protein
VRITVAAGRCRQYPKLISEETSTGSTAICGDPLLTSLAAVLCTSQQRTLPGCFSPARLRRYSRGASSGYMSIPVYLKMVSRLRREVAHESETLPLAAKAGINRTTSPRYRACSISPAGSSQRSCRERYHRCRYDIRNRRISPAQAWNKNAGWACRSKRKRSNRCRLTNSVSFRSVETHWIFGSTGRGADGCGIPDAGGR